jgi:hypothetical protein
LLAMESGQELQVEKSRSAAQGAASGVIHMHLVNMAGRLGAVEAAIRRTDWNRGAPPANQDRLGLPESSWFSRRCRFLHQGLPRPVLRGHKRPTRWQSHIIIRAAPRKE